MAGGGRLMRDVGWREAGGGKLYMRLEAKCNWGFDACLNKIHTI